MSIQLQARVRKMARIARVRRVRAKISGTTTKPRVAVFRSNTGVQLQLIDDLKGQTMAVVFDRDLKGTKTERAKAAGVKMAELAKKKGIETVVFDRGGFKYHGRVAAVADGLREGGIKV